MDSILEWFDSIYEHYSMVFINTDTQVIRFETDTGWYTESTLTQELAWWILTRKLEVYYE